MTTNNTFPEGNFHAEIIADHNNGIPDVLAAAMVIGHEIRGLTNAVMFTKTDHEFTEAIGLVDPVRLDPAADEFGDHVEAMAAALWETDQTNRSAARTFMDDYEAIQDRYRVQARLLLDPSEGQGK